MHTVRGKPISYMIVATLVEDRVAYNAIGGGHVLLRWPSEVLTLFVMCVSCSRPETSCSEL